MGGTHGFRSKSGQLHRGGPKLPYDPVMDEIAPMIQQVSAALLEDAEELSAAVSTAITERLPALVAEPAIVQEVIVSTRANILRFLRAAAEPDAAFDDLLVPAEALDLARVFVRRGIDLEILVHTYRWGQNVALQLWLRRAMELVPAELLPAVLDRAAPLLFAYVDGVLAQMGEQVERERSQLRSGTAARREQTVRLLLDGAPIDIAGASALLAHDLLRTHTAFVVWVDPGTDVAHGDLELVAAAVGRAGGSRSMLTIAPGRTSLWGWVLSDAPPPADALREAAGAAAPHPRLAVGGTHGGVDGFRRSHEEALGAQALLLAGDAHRRFIAHREVEVVALVAGDRRRLQEFVLETLGPLTPADGRHADLAETVRIYLDEGDHAARTAARLGTHRNTVLQRVARAERLLGHPLGERRLALAVALEADAHLGLSGNSASGGKFRSLITENARPA